MARQSSAIKRQERLAAQQADLIARRAELLGVTARCRDSRCPCHWREWRELIQLDCLLNGKAPPDDLPGDWQLELRA